MDLSRLRDRNNPLFPALRSGPTAVSGVTRESKFLQSLRARSTNHGFAAGRDSRPALDVNGNALETAFTHVGYQPPPGQFLFDRQTLRFAARDIPLVPEPGTAWWRDFHQHDLAEGKACKSPQGPGETEPDVVVLVRRVVVVAVRGGQVVVVVVPGAPAQPARRAGLFHAGCRTRLLPPNTAARKRQLSACATWPIHDITLDLMSAKVPFRLTRSSRFT